jgi:hypothetical protein
MEQEEAIAVGGGLTRGRLLGLQEETVEDLEAIPVLL